MLKKEILHIHTDPKFLSDTLIYIDSRVSNTIIFIGTETDELVVKMKALNINYLIINTENSVNKLLEIIKGYDLIVLNELCEIKEQLLLKSPISNKFYLRLFGYELYAKKIHKYLHVKTIKEAYPIIYKNKGLKPYIKARIKRFLKIDFNFNKEEQKVIYSKLQAILLFSREEYEELNKYFYLPKFIQLPLYFINNNISKKTDTIILGNSRHYWNNHLEVLKLLKNTNPKIFLFFNYGPINNYTAKVEKEAENFNNVTFITNFMKIKDFNNIYSTASALVINSYRQHALGNIFTAILSGCKIYLNPKSPTYKWLVNNNFIINSIYDLKKNIIDSNYKLSIENMNHNISRCNYLKNEYNNQQFITNLIEIIE